ncbi:glycosyltransferase family 2 protein [Rufibacter latericius]|uniref:Glycosyltransferase n=1 Tax=Rufibacter latericius TaxID=2487040 RepID=A0A3M9MG71_9BACT|nr:glycosyltransferase [Rufibacter latericius]RNI24549.1 glycosyltransferase [Rufibacter latericius]
MIPVYNCSSYLPETLESVLMQGFPEDEMQIEVIDDASTDASVEELVQQIGKGRVKYYRQPKNVGSLRNFETSINRAQGTLVHLLHGDDRVLGGFYKRMGGLFKQFPEAGAAMCRFRYINEKGEFLYNQTLETEKEGILENWLIKAAIRNPSQYAATVVRRNVYEQLGSFYGLTYGEDWEMWVRIARNYPFAYTPEILADYRKHFSSISSNKFLTGQNSEDMLQVMKLIQEMLPEEHKKEVLQKSKKFYAHYGIRVANQVWQTAHHKDGVKAQIRNAVGMHLDVPLLWGIAKVYLKIALNRS